MGKTKKDEAVKETKKPEIKAEETVEMSELEELRALVKTLQAQVQQAQTVRFVEKQDDERVILRFQAECADDNVAIFGQNGMYGQVYGKTGRIVVPKIDFATRFINETTRTLLNERVLIVLSGLNEEERELYGVNYKEGELLDEKAFNKLLDLGEELLELYPTLCDSNKEMIARRFATAYHEGDPRAKDRKLIVALNKLSRKDLKNLAKDDPRKRGAFASIIDAMNADDSNEE